MWGLNLLIAKNGVNSIFYFGFLEKFAQKKSQSKSQSTENCSEIRISPQRQVNCELFKQMLKKEQYQLSFFILIQRKDYVK